jgi:SAM-dependent methyltransferase
MGETPETGGWDAASEGYASHVAPQLMAPFMQEFVERLGADRQMRALEVACGSGALTAALAPQVQSLLATDFAPRMIETTRQHIDGLGHDNVDFAVMDGQALELDDDAFDCAASSFAIMLFPDRGRGFSELRRVVRPGGRVFVSAWAGPEHFEGFGLFLAAMARAFPEMPPPPAPPPVFSLADLGTFATEMEAAGFADVQTGTTTRELSIASFDAFWSMLTSGAPPVQEMFDTIGEAGKDKLQAALQTVVTEKFGTGPIVTRNRATFAVATAS